MLPQDVIRQVRRIELVTRRLVNPELTGQYHSVFKGRGMDFDEVRPYTDGEDVRFLDWNVSARTGELHVKRFVEERELTVQVVVDASLSMPFGTALETKRKVAAIIAAVLAALAMKNNDRIGLLIFGDAVEMYIPPKKGRKHILRIITEILEHQPKHSRTDLGAALQYVTRVTRRKSIIFVVSDFFGCDFEQQLTIASRRHDVVPITVSDHLEQSFEPNPTMGAPPASFFDRVIDRWFSGGLLHTTDAESGRDARVDFGSSSQKRAFAAQAEKAIAARQHLFQRLRLDTIELRTDFQHESDYVQPLARFFKRRSRRH